MADGQVIMEQMLQSQRVQNVFTFTNLPNDSVTRQEWADNFRAQMSIDLPAGTFSNQWLTEGVTFKYNDSFPSFSVTVPFSAGDFTGIGVSALANQTALLVSTLYAGQKPNRGRVYFAGNTEQDFDATGRFTGAVRDTRVDFIESLRDGILWDGGVQVSQLRIGRVDSQGTLILSNPVETVRGTLVPATQRRRRIGSGI